MKFNISSILASIGIFCVYIFSMYLWYSARQSGSIFILLGPYIVQGLAIALVIFKTGSKSVFLTILSVVVGFAAVTALVHLIAGYFYVAVDWSGVHNFPLVFSVQFVISAIVALFVWVVFFIASCIYNKRKKYSS